MIAVTSQTADIQAILALVTGWITGAAGAWGYRRYWDIREAKEEMDRENIKARMADKSTTLHIVDEYDSQAVLEDLMYRQDKWAAEWDRAKDFLELEVSDG